MASFKNDDRHVRFGVIGFGKIARTRFLPAIVQSESARLTAIASRRPPSELSESLVKLKNTPQVTSYEQLLAENNGLVDAVYISLPNHLHTEWVIRCAEAGIHVLCEKPISGSHEGALRCREICEERGVLLAEGFMYRHDPRHRRVKELMHAGVIGQVNLLEASFSYFLEDLNNIRLSQERLGGALMDVGCYGIDLARHLFGEDPIEVTARALWGQHSCVDELTAVTLLFPSGRLATVTASTHLARLNSYRIRGTKGSITVPDAFIPKDDQITRIEIEADNKESKIEQFPPFIPFIAEIDAFARAILDQSPCIPSPMEDGVNTAKVLEAAARSSLTESQRVELSWPLS